ncbi:OmpA family protein, partial [Dysgonomonas mossii]
MLPYLYIARELNTHFYLDVQGNLSFTEQYVDGKDKLKTAFMVGPG